MTLNPIHNLILINMRTERMSHTLIAMTRQTTIQIESLSMERQHFWLFNQLQNVHWRVLLRNVHHHSPDGVQTQHGPATNVRQLQCRRPKTLIWNTSPVPWIQLLDSQTRRTIGGQVLVWRLEYGGRQREVVLLSAQLKLEDFRWGRCNEHGRVEHCSGFQLWYYLFNVGVLGLTLNFIPVSCPAARNDSSPTDVSTTHPIRSPETFVLVPSETAFRRSAALSM